MAVLLMDGTKGIIVDQQGDRYFIEINGVELVYYREDIKHFEK